MEKKNKKIKEETVSSYKSVDAIKAAVESVSLFKKRLSDVSSTQTKYEEDMDKYKKISELARKYSGKSEFLKKEKNNTENLTHLGIVVDGEGKRSEGYVRISQNGTFELLNGDVVSLPNMDISRNSVVFNLSDSDTIEPSDAMKKIIKLRINRESTDLSDAEKEIGDELSKVVVYAKNHMDGKIANSAADEIVETYNKYKKMKMVLAKILNSSGVDWMVDFSSGTNSVYSVDVDAETLNLIQEILYGKDEDESET